MTDSQSDRYASLEDLYTYLRVVADRASLENCEADQPQEQTSTELVPVEVMTEEDRDETDGLESCLSSSHSLIGSSICGSPSDLSEAEMEAKSSGPKRVENTTGTTTAIESSATKQDGAMRGRMRSFSDATYQHSMSKTGAMATLQKCRRFMSFPHISTLAPEDSTSPNGEQSRTPEDSTSQNGKHSRTPEDPTIPNDEQSRAPEDSITVSVLEMSESLGNCEILNKDNAGADERATPREELIKTWSREEMRRRSWSEPSFPYQEPEFQRSASSRRMSVPNRLLLVEPFDKPLGRASLTSRSEKLERLVEETQQEEDREEPARACSESMTSLSELTDDTTGLRHSQELRHSRDALDEREPGEVYQEHAQQQHDVDVPTLRCFSSHLSPGDVIATSRLDLERLLAAEEVRRQLREDLAAEKVTVKILEKDNGDLRREIHRREKDIKTLQKDVWRRQNLLDQILTQDKQQSDLVSELKELLHCGRRTGGVDLQDLRDKVGELQGFKSQLQEVKSVLLQVPRQQDITIVEWFRKLETQLSRTENAVRKLGKNTQSQDKTGRFQESRLLELKLEKSETERMRLENENRKLMEEKPSISCSGVACAKCKDLAAERQMRLLRDKKSLEKELEVVKAQLEESRREVRTLQATDINPKAILLECENRALKAELEFLKEKDAIAAWWSHHGNSEDARCASESDTFFDEAEDGEEPTLSSRVSSETELELSEGSLVCCDFTTESERDDSQSGSSEVHSQRTRRVKAATRKRGAGRKESPRTHTKSAAL